MGARIMVVEDEALIAEEISDRLRRSQFEVVGIEDTGEAALQTAARTRPDLVLMDIRLKGGMDGIEAARQLRERLDIPVVYLTAHADRATLQRAKATAPLGYLLKPFEERELVITVEMAVNRHSLEQRLRESELRFASTLSSIGDGVIATDLQGRVTYMNPVAEALTGWSLEEARGLLAERVFEISREPGRSIPTHPVTEALRRQAVIHFTESLLLMGRDGNAIPIDDSAAPILDDRGRVIGVVVAFRDIRERRLAEDALRQAAEVVTHAQKMEAIGRLAGGVAHDFNNLLTVINGNADLLLGAALPADARGLVAEILQAGERATALTGQLLAMSRKQVVVPRPIDLNALLASEQAMLRRLIGENVTLVSDHETGLPLVLADPGQVEQVVLNLVVNARDAMPQGGTLTIETAAVDVDEAAAARNPDVMPGRFVELSVIDTGLGMDEATKAHVFEPFFTTKPAGHGTGLGLAMVYGIVRQCDGHVLVHSEPGAGTTFRIRFPALAEGAAASGEPGRRDADPHGTERVLLVEDDESVRAATAKMLEQYGYRVLKAGNAAEAIRISSRAIGSIDALIADVVLPGMSGRRLAEQLRTLRPALRVLLLSGAADDPALRDFVSGAETAFLQKPFRAVTLALGLRELLDRPVRA